MKKLLLAVLLASSTSVAANDNVTFCTGVYELAESVMGARQAGVPLSQMLNAESKFDPSIREALIDVILAAYEEPDYSTEKMQKRAVVQFANAAMSACMKGMK